MVKGLRADRWVRLLGFPPAVYVLGRTMWTRFKSDWKNQKAAESGPARNTLTPWREQKSALMEPGTKQGTHSTVQHWPQPGPPPGVLQPRPPPETRLLLLLLLHLRPVHFLLIGDNRLEEPAELISSNSFQSHLGRLRWSSVVVVVVGG